MEAYARQIVETKLNKRVIALQRFTTGLSHYVFDVAADDHVSYVIRIARPERNAQLKRGLYWQAELEKVGILMPEIYQSGEVDGRAYAVYEKLPGLDLETAYPSLTSPEKKEIAHTVAAIQQRIHILDGPLFEKIHPWMDVLQWIVNLSKREMVATGLCDSRYVDQVRQRLQTYAPYFTAVQPQAFLYDLNVRNVIVQNGKVTGIIDVDDMWYGDPLLAIGRGKTILLMMRQDTDFIDHWCDFLNLSPQQLEMVDFYALLYTIRFMGTMGQRLNGNQSIQTDPNVAPLLEKMAHRLL